MSRGLPADTKPRNSVRPAAKGRNRTLFQIVLQLVFPMSRSYPQVLYLWIVISVMLIVPASAAHKGYTAADNLSPETVNAAAWHGGPVSGPLQLKLQVMLDRAHASPGVIDANWGENTRKAVAAFRTMHGLAGAEQVDEPFWRALIDNDSAPPLVIYKITEKDVAGPFTQRIQKISTKKPA